MAVRSLDPKLARSSAARVTLLSKAELGSLIKSVEAHGALRTHVINGVLDGFSAEWRPGTKYGVMLVKGATMPLPLWIVAGSEQEGLSLAREAVTAIEQGRAPKRGVFRVEGVLPAHYASRYQ